MWGAGRCRADVQDWGCLLLHATILLLCPHVSVVINKPSTDICCHIAHVLGNSESKEFAKNNLLQCNGGLILPRLTGDVVLLGGRGVELCTALQILSQVSRGGPPPPMSPAQNNPSLSNTLGWRIGLKEIQIYQVGSMGLLVTWP